VLRVGIGEAEGGWGRAADGRLEVLDRELNLRVVETCAGGYTGINQQQQVEWKEGAIRSGAHPNLPH
jgi:hypothetical protein